MVRVRDHQPRGQRFKTFADFFPAVYGQWSISTVVHDSWKKTSGRLACYNYENGIANMLHHLRGGGINKLRLTNDLDSEDGSIANTSCNMVQLCWTDLDTADDSAANTAQCIQTIPRKSSAEKWSASQTCRLSLAGILISVSSHENIVSFRELTIFSSATK